MSLKKLIIFSVFRNKLSKSVLILTLLLGFANLGFSHFSQQNCIPVDKISHSLCVPIESINSAFTRARQKYGLERPFAQEFFDSDEDQDLIDKLGRVLTETTRIIALGFDLNHEDIYYLIPKLVTEKNTDIWKFCPGQFKEKICSSYVRFRTLSGHCNNLAHPDWGARLTPFQNLLKPERPDGIDAPRDEDKRIELPNPRLVSSIIHRDKVRHDHAVTMMLIAWGQALDHDITLTGDTRDRRTFKEPDCCNSPNIHHNCKPIHIPPNDAFYKSHGQSCMNFARSLYGVRTNCRLGPRNSFNTISSFLDGNFIYGTEPRLAMDLRTGKDGLLKSTPLFKEYNMKDLLPLKIEKPDDGCIRNSKEQFCFKAGDARVNEQLVLTVLHTIFMREHNRIASKLASLNKHWSDERIYQEGRHIVAALIQHITYNEFLPMVLGREAVERYGLSLESKGYWRGYDPTINPGAFEEFITAAFRFGHSLLPHKIERWSSKHRFLESDNLSNFLRRPFVLYRAGYMDTFISGLSNQLAQSMDEGITDEVTTMLFKEPNKHFGFDLAAINIQRGRDHGIPAYTEYRKACGLSPIYDWDDLHEVMPNETIYKYKSVYRSPVDIDLWSGGISEITRNSLVGPTFACIIGNQFRALRHGDRFWYELPDQVSSFTPEQLRQIRKAKLATIMCENSDAVKTIQKYVMAIPDAKVNPRIGCQNEYYFPRMNLDFWAEVPPPDVPKSHPGFKPFVEFNSFKDPSGKSSHDGFKPPEVIEKYSSEENKIGHNNLRYGYPPDNDRKFSKTLINKIPPPLPSHTLEIGETVSTKEPLFTIEIEKGGGSTVSKLLKSGEGEELVTELRPPTTMSVPYPPKHSVKPPKNPPPPPHPNPYHGNTPFPGMSGIYSPNPGYLTRQNFVANSVGRFNNAKPPTSIWGKLFG